MLTVKKEEKFKILQLTDLHIGCGFLSRKTDELAAAAVREIAEKSKPDLIIVTGDSVYPMAIFSGTRNNKRETEYFISLMESFKTPWSIVFGNHDAERHSKLTKSELGKMYKAAPHCIFEDGDFKIELKNEDGTPNTDLFMIDSNAYVTKNFFSGFDNVHDGQVDWYKANVRENVPSVMFLHIPPSEYKDAWLAYKAEDESAKYFFGKNGEGKDYCGVPEVRSKIFDAILEKGSTKAVFCGHDHLNTFSIEYKGVRLTYGMSIDYLAYRHRHIKKSTFQRGGTLIEIDSNSNFSISQVPLAN